MKNVEQLTESVGVRRTVGDMHTPVHALTYDSRTVGDGDCFFAVVGSVSDGHAYIGQAIERGARTVVCQTIPAQTHEGVCYVEVDDTNAAMAAMASAFYGDPSRELKLVGVTGTNGKTTIATLLCDLFERLGYKAGLISTVVYRTGVREIESTHTTPDTIRLNAMLREMAGNGC